MPVTPIAFACVTPWSTSIPSRSGCRAPRRAGRPGAASPGRSRGGARVGLAAGVARSRAGRVDHRVAALGVEVVVVVEAPCRRRSPRRRSRSRSCSRRRPCTITIVGNGPSPVGGSVTSTSIGTPSKVGTRWRHRRRGRTGRRSAGARVAERRGGAAGAAGGGSATVAVAASPYEYPAYHEVVVFFRALPGVPSLLRPFDLAVTLAAARAASRSSLTESSMSRRTVEVGERVVVAHEADVDAAVVAHDRDCEPVLGARNGDRHQLLHLAPEQVERELRARARWSRAGCRRGSRN